MASKQGSGKNSGSKNTSASKQTTQRRSASAPQDPVIKPGAADKARARNLHEEARDRGLRLTEAKQSLVPREGSAIPDRVADTLSREETEAHVRGLGLTCQGPRGKDGTRPGCGFDIGELVLLAPLDGREYDYRCPECGNQGSFRAPLITVE